MHPHGIITGFCVVGYHKMFFDLEVAVAVEVIGKDFFRVYVKIDYCCISMSYGVYLK